MQKKLNAIALPMELYLICIMPPIKYISYKKDMHMIRLCFFIYVISPL